MPTVELLNEKDPYRDSGVDDYRIEISAVGQHMVPSSWLKDFGKAFELFEWRDIPLNLTNCATSSSPTTPSSNVT
jgi:hypothetical protein